MYSVMRVEPKEIRQNGFCKSNIDLSKFTVQDQI